ncbi:conserved protein of unknown function [Thiomonas sp. Sup16B3]|nr:conserved protein of unknown function [Thiomonas sp. Sup16B3]
MPETPMLTSALRPDTAALWQALQHPEVAPLLRGFVLVGGSALTLRIGHRVSEDLDLAYSEGKLPVVRIPRLMDALARHGIDCVRQHDLAAEEEFFESGLDLADYQQNFVAQCSVKLTLVSLDQSARTLIGGDAASPLRVATLDEIFKTKALVCADRSKTRDWYDLHTLMTEEGYTIADLHNAFVESGQPSKYDIAKSRMTSGRPEASDEGYLQLAGRSKPTLDVMRDYFEAGFREFEVASMSGALRLEREADQRCVPKPRIASRRKRDIAR